MYFGCLLIVVLLFIFIYNLAYTKSLIGQPQQLGSGLFSISNISSKIEKLASKKKIEIKLNRNEAIKIVNEIGPTDRDKVALTNEFLRLLKRYDQSQKQTVIRKLGVRCDTSYTLPGGVTSIRDIDNEQVDPCDF